MAQPMTVYWRCSPKKATSQSLHGSLPTEKRDSRAVSDSSNSDRKMMRQRRLRNLTAWMSKAVRSRSTKRDRRNRAAVEGALVVDGDFLAGGLVGAVDVEATSCRQSVAWSCRSKT
jgi:hypothetical protein